MPGWVPDVESVDDGDAERRSLWLVDVASGEARRVSAEDRNVWEADWCGAGHAVAVTSDGAGEDAWYGAGVSLVDLASGEERPLASSDVQFGWVAGSPSGATVAVIEAVCSDRVVVCGDLRLIDVASGTMSPVDLGDVDASRAVWLDEDRLLVFGRRGLVSLALEVTAAGIVREIWTTDGSVGELYHPSGAAFGDGIAVLTSSHHRPPSIVVVDREGAEREVAAPRHAGHDVVLGAVGRREAMRWTSTDGLEIEGLLTLPPGEGPFPLVLDVHGGPIGSSDDRFPGTLDALLLTRGFAILEPNPRGSTGHGQGFAGSGRRRHGRSRRRRRAHRRRRRGRGRHRRPRSPRADGGKLRRVHGRVDPDARSAVQGLGVDLPGDRLVVRAVRQQPRRVGGRLPRRAAARGARGVLGPQSRAARRGTSRPRCCSRRGATTGRHRWVRPSSSTGRSVEHGVPAEVVLYPQEGHGVGEFPAILDLATRTVAWFERFLPATGDGR